MRNCDIVLCSGAQHLRDSFERMGYNVHVSCMNYDGKRFFPNDDLYTRLEGVASVGGGNVCIVQSGGLSSEAERERFRVSDRFFEVLQVLDILGNPLEVEKKGDELIRKELDAPKEITVIYTFLPFSKQDHAYETGEANSARLAIGLPLDMGADKVAVVDPHPPLEFRWVQELLSDGIYEALSIMPRLIEKAKALHGLKEPLVLSPPGKKKYKESELVDLKKKRIDSFTVMFEGTMDVKGKEIILADDLVLSGSTLIKTRDKLLEMGAKEVVCCVPHALPLHDGEEKLRSLVKKLDGKIVVSNTVATSTFADGNNVVDVAGLLGDWPDQIPRP